MEMMPAGEFNQIAEAAFTERLAPLGFESAKANKWVCSDSGPNRKLFALYNLKSLSLVPTWGFSFDFVPHLGAGDDVKWHRTAKSSLFDLSYDPLDYTRDVHGWSLTRFASSPEVAAAASTLADRSVRQAVEFWQRVQRLEDVAAVFEEWRTRPAVRFGFDNYVRAPLVYAFVLARLGRLAEGREWLEKYLTGDIRPEAKPDLRKRLEEAGVARAG